MVDHFLGFTGGGEQVLKSAAPNSRVVTVSKVFGFGPIQDGFDPAAEPGCGFIADQPDRFKALQDIVTSDCLNLVLAKNRAGMLGQGVRPLLGMFLVFPLVAFGFNVRCRTLIESQVSFVCPACKIGSRSSRCFLASRRLVSGYPAN